MKNRTIRWTVMIMAAGAVWGEAADSLPAHRLERVTAFPVTTATTTGVVTIDGDLGEWRTESFVTIVLDPALREVRSCRIAVAYDDAGLVVAMDFIDDTPLQSHVDPLGDPFLGWRGDSMQMRFIATPDKISHWTWWYYPAREQPAVDVRYEMGFVDPVTLTDADAPLKYRKRADGYSFELRMSWERLRAKGAGGDVWRTTLQPHWNVFGSEVVTFADCITAEEAGMYRRPHLWGELRFASAETAAQRLVEQAALEQKRTQMGRAESPTWGFPVKVTTPVDGFVSLAVADAEGRSVRTLLAKAQRSGGEFTEFWDGLDDEGNPVPAGRYHLKALTHPGIKPKFVTSVMNSGTPPWVTADGKGSWGGDHGNPIAAAAGPNGWTFLMWTMDEAGSFLIGVDESGRKQWGGHIPWGGVEGVATALTYDEGHVYVAKNGGLLIYDAVTGGRSSFPDGRAEIPAQDWPGAGGNLSGLAAAPGALYVALAAPGKVLALDKQTLQPVKSWDVPKAGHIVSDAVRRRIYAVGDGKVWAIDPAGDAPPQPFIRDGLDEPRGLAVDDKGNVYVAQRGNRMCVGVYDPTGTAARVIGKAGGRPMVGRYDPSGMLLPAGICVDTLGRLWVTEEDNMPKRISQWDARDGKLLREFFGGAAYAVMMAPDPEQPEHVYLHNCRFIVDYDKGTSRPDATVYRGGGDSQGFYGFMGSSWQISRYQGRTFAYNGKGGVFAWGEDQFQPLVARAEGVEGNIFQFGGAFFPGAAFIKGKYNGEFRLFRPQGLTPEGVPIYPEFKDAPRLVTGTGPMTRYSNRMDVWPSLESDWQEFYAIASLDHPVHGGLPDGGGGDGIYRFTPAGEIRWRYPRVKVYYAIKDQRLAGPGDLMGAIRIAGLVQMPPEHGGEIIAIGCYRAYFGLVSGNGLFIDKISDDKGKGLPPDVDTFFIENFSGYFFRHPQTGKVYLFCGDTDGRILELQGFENIRCFDGGSFNLAETDVARLAGARERARREELPAATDLTVVRVDGPPTPDAAAFPARAMRRLDLDETRAAAVGLCHDAANLHALFRVDDPSPWRNGATDWKMLFKGGDGLDIQLGDNDGRARVRVFVTPGAKDGEFLAVGMWPTAPPAGHETQPESYQSPVGQETFAHVAKLAGVTVQVTKREAGYTAVVTIPWTEIGMTPLDRGTALRGDLGVLFSDPAGTRTIRRRYLFNTETAIVDDIPSEVRLKPQAWGDLRFE